MLPLCSPKLAGDTIPTTESHPPEHLSRAQKSHRSPSLIPQQPVLHQTRTSINQTHPKNTPTLNHLRRPNPLPYSPDLLLQLPPHHPPPPRPAAACYLAQSPGNIGTTAIPFCCRRRFVRGTHPENTHHGALAVAHCFYGVDLGAFRPFRIAPLLRWCCEESFADPRYDNSLHSLKSKYVSTTNRPRMTYRANPRFSKHQ